MFAPRYHPAMKHVAPVRKALGVRTAFNVLGPLLNPASARYALVGVYSRELLELMASALQARSAAPLAARPNCLPCECLVHGRLTRRFGCYGRSNWAWRVRSW